MDQSPLDGDPLCHERKNQGLDPIRPTWRRLWKLVGDPRAYLPRLQPMSFAVDAPSFVAATTHNVDGNEEC